MTTTVTPTPSTNKVAATISTVAADIEQYTPFAINAVQQVEATLQHAPSQTKLNTAIAIISAAAAASEAVPIPEAHAVGGLVSLVAGLVQALFPHKTESNVTATEPTAASVAATIPVVDAVATAAAANKLQ